MPRKKVTAKPRRGRPPLSQSEGSRERILDAALAFFSVHGYEKTSLKDIAGSLGMEAPAIYGHFASKKHLKDELIASGGPALLRLHLKTFFDSTPLSDPEKKLSDAMEVVAQHWLRPRERQFFRFLLLENLESDQDSPLSVKRLHQSMHQTVEPIISELVSAGVLRNLPIDWLTRQFTSPLQVRRQALAFDGDEVSEQELIRDLKHHVQCYFRAFRTVNPI
jgi:AcrR family transcriptional regulator